jgi:EmrB/QacA subfamily drug resistance transporter
VNPPPDIANATTAPLPPGEATRSPWPTFALCALASYITTLDISIVNVAFPEILRTFHTTRADASWIVTIYNICFAGLLIVSGKLADQLGRKRMFLMGTAIFAIGSTACAFAPSLALIIAGRCVQGIGGAILAPASLGLLLSAFPPERRTTTVAQWGIFGALGIASGPSLGAALITLTNWRAAFWVNLPVCLAMIWFGRKHLRETARIQRSHRPDLLGALLITVSLAALALGLSRSEVWGWTNPRTIVSLAVAIVAAPLFWRRQGRHPDPILDLALFRSRAFTVANLSSISFYGLNNVLFLRGVWHYTLLHAGLLSALPPITVATLAPQVGRLLPLYGFRRFVIAGPLIFAASAAGSRFVLGAKPAPWTFLAIGELVAVGVASFIPSNTAVSVSGLPADRLSIGGAVTNTSRQVGSVIGIAALVAVIGSPKSPVSLLAAHQRGFVLNVIFGVVAAIVAIGQPKQ